MAREKRFRQAGDEEQDSLLLEVGLAESPKGIVTAYSKIRKGVLQHLIEGKLGLHDFGVYVILHLECNFETGVWTGSASRLATTAPHRTTARKVQESFDRLREIKFIRAFENGSRKSNHQILIHKYEPQTGPHSGMRLDAYQTESPEHLIFEPCLVTPQNGARKQPFSDANLGENAIPLSPTPPYPLNQKQEQEQNKQQEKQKLCTPEIMAEAYRAERGDLLPDLRELTPERRTKCVQRIHTHRKNPAKFAFDFRAAIHRAAETPFLLGMNSSGWKPNFDWFIANDTNFQKVLEGRYDGQPPERKTNSEIRTERTQTAIARAEQMYRQMATDAGRALPAADQRGGNAGLLRGAARLDGK